MTNAIQPPIQQAVVLAAGRGVRASPHSRLLNKCLLPIHDHPIVEGQLRIARDQLGVRDVVMLLGHLGDQVRDALGDGSALGLSIRYVDVENVEQGPARALLALRRALPGPFWLLLGDEYHHAPKHRRLLDHLDRGPDALLTYVHTMNPQQVGANFSLRVGADDRLEGIEEKPERIRDDLCGCGTMLLTPAVFDAIEAAAPSPRTGRVELYEVAAGLGRVYAVDLEDPLYVNVNTADDLRRARYAYRSAHFGSFRTSVVIPTWNEAGSVEAVVRDFASQPQVSEILVMDNESSDGTAQKARDAGARVVSRPLRGYGDALRQGLDEATGDILVLVEADFTFRASDLSKLLEYLKDADMVVGTRTTRQLIAQGANMQALARIGNVLMAKYLELLWVWLEPRFTDVGCTYRAIWRTEWSQIRDRTTSDGPAFSPEMMLEVVKARKLCIEVPVSYHPRLGGESKHSRGFTGLAKTAIAMWALITRRWLSDLARSVFRRVD